MFAVSGDLPPDDGAWVFEAKWDGVRALVHARDGAVTVRSRNDLDTTGSWPELAHLAATLPEDTLLDGEIVALGPAGAPDFNVLQQRMHVRHPTAALLREVPAVLMAFDVLTLAGQDVTLLPWTQRRELLEHLDLGGSAQAPPVFDGPGSAVLEACLGQGLEGVMAKRRSALYVPGRRSEDWVKVKPVRRQEFVICGWEPGSGGRAGRLGSVYLAVYDGAALAFAGKAGSGFNDRSLADLHKRLQPLVIPQCPFPEVPAGTPREVTWVAPTLVCEIEFMAWTNEGRLRHPVYKGLRNDKDPRDVIREG